MARFKKGSLVRGLAVFIVLLLCVAVIPVNAAVTKTTSVYTGTQTSKMEVAPGISVDCTRHYTTEITSWQKDSAPWKTDINERDSGTCSDGTTFECNTNLINNEQDGSSFPSGVYAYTGDCMFSYLDGGKAKSLAHETLANGEVIKFFFRWN